MSIAILGSGVSGIAVFDYLKKRGVDSRFINFEKPGLSQDEKDLDEIFKDVEQLIVSPGIKIDKNIKFYLKKKKIALYGELEFGTRKISNDIIAVTGTNGKTTTVSLIYYLLKDYQGGVVLGGNIGTPVTSLVDKLNGCELVVLECSSFQLETIRKFRPHIAVVLNLDVDHLNRHGTMREYIRCKYRITKNQLSSDFLLLNADDELIRKNPPKTKAQIFYFSTKSKVLGVYIKNKFVYFYDGFKDVKLVSVSNLKLKGEHNLSNVLASILAVYLETGNLVLLKNLPSFEGVKHRIEFVKNIRGVEFFNDSKATNISSTLAACNSFKQNILLILGGSDKGYNFDELFKNLPKNVKFIAIFGEVKHKIAFSAKKYKFNNFKIFDTLEQSVRFLYDNSKKGDVILLSPACASFDQFSNYEERGEVFRNIVLKIESE